MQGPSISKLHNKPVLTLTTVFVVTILIIITQSTTGAASAKKQPKISPDLAAEVWSNAEIEAQSSEPVPDRGIDTPLEENSASVYRCDYPDVTIPDNDLNGTYQGQEIYESGTIVDLDIYLDVSHTYIADLKFDLEHIDTGTRATFYYQPDCWDDDIVATFDDEASLPFPVECPGSGTPAIQGRFRPYSPLSAFDGEDVNGQWRIYAYDLAGGDIGTLNQWCITAEVTSDVGPVVYDGHVIDDDNSGSSSGNNDSQVNCGENIELDVWLRNEGTATAPLVYAWIDSSDPYVTSIIDPEPQDPDIPGGGRVLFPGLYFEVASNTPDGHEIIFDLAVNDDLSNFWNDSFVVPVACISTPVCFPLTRTYTGPGSDPTASPANSSGCSSGSYHEGQSITMTPHPAADYHLDHWTGTNSTNSNQLTMPASARTVTAHYVQDTPDCFTLTVIASPKDGGTIKQSPSPNCGNGQYLANTKVQLTAQPNFGYAFSYWNDVSSEGLNPTFVTMNSDRSVTANFAEQVITGKVRGADPSKGNVPLREMRVELLRNGEVIASNTTSGGNDSDAGVYKFGLSGSESGSYKVRATLVQPKNSAEGIGGFEVKYMPPLLGDPIPYLETVEFTIPENEVTINKDISFEQDFVRQGGKTNLGSSAHKWLDDLAIIYYHTQQAEDFAIKELGISNLGYVYIHAFDNHKTSYRASDNVIFIKEDNASISSKNRPENREWHEYFHHVMSETNFVNQQKPSCGNHEGFLNANTADSWVEGWAMFWAEILDDHLGYASSGWYMDWYYLDSDHEAWDTETEKEEIVQREDLAVASLLWDLFDSGDSDDDAFSIDIPQISNLLLNKQNNATYQQIENMEDLHGILTAAYPKNDVNELYIAHGFFGDGGWVMQGCGAPSKEGDRQRVAGEIIGKGGREGRSDLPHLNNANLLVKLVTETGGPVFSGYLIVNFTYPPPYDIYNASIVRKAQHNSLFHISPPPARIPMRIEVRGDSPQSGIYSSTNVDYWNIVAVNDEPYVAEATFTVKETAGGRLAIFLPVISNP